jgi:putative peptide zinc metalloprotease protein
LAVTKILHEFGHGFSCKHFGGECHEMGFMLLVLTPCLYCNVSDSWLLPNKWHRMVIGAAGIIVECLLASIATYIWWFSEPGLLNYLALRVMFICSVSTVLFNGNPLLRYDGYYILSDLVEIPNLRQKSSSILNRLLAKWCLGMELPEEPFLPERNRFFFGLYTVASAIYRWVVMLSILYFLYKVFEPYGLQAVGQTIAAASIASMIYQPLSKLYKFFKVPGRIDQVKWPNVYATSAVVAAVVVGILLIPVPRRVGCTLEIRPRDAAQVYVAVPGRLDQVFVEPGQQVAAGTPLAALSNTGLRLTVAELTSQRDQYQARLASLRRQRHVDKEAAGEIPQVQKTLQSLAAQIADTKAEMERLSLVAPVAGTILEPPRRHDKNRPEGTLRGWQGSLLDSKNLGAVVTDSELFCEIGDPHHLEAVLVIDQTDIELVNEDDHPEVRIQLESRPGETFTGRIAEISRIDMKVAPRSLSNQAGGDLATRTDASGVTHPMNTSYTARVPLDVPEGHLQIGLRGNALIYTGTQPLGGRIWRYLSHTFHFAL